MEMLGATFEWWAAGSHPEIQRGFTLRSSRPITSMACGQFSRLTYFARHLMRSHVRGPFHFVFNYSGQRVCTENSSAK